MAAAAFVTPVVVARPLGGRPTVGGGGGGHLAVWRPTTAWRRVAAGAAPRWSAAADGVGGRGGPGETAGGGDGGGGGDTLGKSIAKVLEVSYRKVWLRLMTVGTGDEYVRLGGGEGGGGRLVVRRGGGCGGGRLFAVPPWLPRHAGDPCGIEGGAGGAWGAPVAVPARETLLPWPHSL